MPKANVIAILVADIHLSHNPPLARSEEPDWYKAMARPLKQLGLIADKHMVPIFCAGDVFDHWNSSAELINFALIHLPTMSAIPGQHDLPNHNFDEIHRSAYWTMVEAGVIRSIGPEYTTKVPVKTSKKGDPELFLNVGGFPWGVELIPLRKHETEIPTINLALIHSYCWIENHGYSGASEDRLSSKYRKKLEGYDVLVFGDNHIPFITDGQSIVNCGSFMKRTSDQKDHEPSVWILHEDETITRHFLDCSEDVFTVTEKREDQPELDVSKLVEELSTLAEGAVDFTEAVKQYCEENGVKKDVQLIIKEAMEK